MDDSPSISSEVNRAYLSGNHHVPVPLLPIEQIRNDWQDSISIWNRERAVPPPFRGWEEIILHVDDHQCCPHGEMMSTSQYDVSGL